MIAVDLTVSTGANRVARAAAARWRSARI